MLEVMDKLTLTKIVVMQIKSQQPIDALTLSKLSELSGVYSLNENNVLSNKYGAKY